MISDFLNFWPIFSSDGNETGGLTNNTGFNFDLAPSGVLYQEWLGASPGTWPNPAPPATDGIQPYNYSITLTVVP